MINIAIIPARGGSKGMPRKNLQLLGGKPLIAHTIEQSLLSQVDLTIVSTDDIEIADISKQYGALVLWRPSELATDTSTTESVLLHTLDNINPDFITLLQCTSPLTLAEDINGTIQALGDADSALSVTPFNHFLWREDGSSINHDKEIRLRRQEMKQFMENGAVYVMRTEGFMRARHRFFGKTALYVMPPERSIEIDEPLDLIIAEAMYGIYHS